MIKGLGLFLLFLLQNAWAQAPDVDAIVGNYLKSAHNIEHKDIFAHAFSPQLEVQKNTGAFTTGYSVPLPVNLLGINSLSFRYSSDESKNYGVGIGWSINLPAILRKKSAGSESEYTVKGFWKSENLIKYDKDLSDFIPFLSKIGLSNEFETYVAEYEQNFNHYLRFLNGSWLVVDKSGKYYKFDQNGLPYEIGDRNGNKLVLKWKSDYLESISSVDWSAKFSYQVANESFVTLYNNLTDQEKLLKKIDVEVGSETKTFLFSYDEQYLVKVITEGATKAFFDGRYSAFEKLVPENISIKKGQKLVFDKSLTVPTVSQNDIGLHFYLDLNGDNFVDRIEYKTGEFFDRLKDKLPSKDGDFNELNGELVPRLSIDEVQQSIEELSLEREVISSNYSDAVGVTRNRVSHIGLNLKPFQIKLEDYRHGGVLFYKPRIIPKQLQAIDIDGDGKSELVVCNGSYQIEQQRFDKDIKRNTLGSYLANQFGDPSAQATKASVYSIEADEHSVSFLVDENIDLNCHQDSLFFDINNDGLIDVINGDEVYFGVRKIERFERRSIKLSDYADIESFAKISDSETQIYFAASERKIKQIGAEQLVKFPLSNQRFSILDGDTSAIENKSPHKMLSAILSPYGGEIEIDYDFYGKWFPKMISKIGNGIKEVDTYSYKTPLIDEASGHFTGYSVVEVETSRNLENFKTSHTKYIYSKDMEASRSFRVDRAPLYGRLLMTATGDQANVETSSGERHIAKFDWSVLKLNESQFFVYVEKELKEIVFGNTIVDSLLIKNEYKFNSNGQLTETIERKISNGLDSTIGSLGFFDVIEQTKYSFNRKTLTPYVNSKIVSDQKNQRNVTQRYTFDRSKNTYTQECRNGALDCRQFFYDEQGRLEAVEASSGQSIQLAYQENSPNVLVKTENGLDTNFNRDRYFGLVTQVIKPTQEELSFHYNSNNELRALERNGVEVIQVEEIDRKRVSLISGINKEILALDDWGRITHSHEVLPKEFAAHSSKNSFDGTIYETAEGSIPLKTSYYDEFKRLIKEIDYRNKITTEYAYSADGISVYKNGVLIKLENRNQMGLMSKQKYKGEIFNLNYTLGPKLSALNSDEFQIKWARTYDGKVEKSNIDSEEISARFFREFFPDQSLESHYDENSQKSYNIVLNSSDQVESVECGWNGCTGIIERNLEYEQGLLTKESLTNNDLNQIVKYSYNKGQLIRKSTQTANTELSYDRYGLLRSKKINHFSYEVEGDYKGRLLSLKPFVNEFVLNDEGKLSGIKFSEKFEIKFHYDGDRLKHLDTFSNGHEKEFLNYEFNKLGLIKRMKQNITEPSSVDIDYDENLKVRGLNPMGEFSRNKNGQVSFLQGKNLSYSFNNLTSIDEFQFYYDQANSLSFAKKSGKTVFEQIDSDTFLVESKLIHALRFGHKIIGVFVDSAFYPVITNHQNSVLAMLSIDGEILWERKYSLSGVKSIVYAKDDNARKLEALTVFSFADLIEIPEIKGIYWSKTRAYSPDIGQWLSLDNEVIWNPDSLLSKDGNWNPYRYAEDDPVNFVDPSGTYSEYVGGLGYVKAGITDFAHYVKYQAISAYEAILGVANSSLTGGGIKPGFNAGAIKISGRFGYDAVSGIEAFGIGSSKFGSLKAEGQFGYSGGGLKAIGRLDGSYGAVSSALTLGTSNNVRGKFDYFINGYGTGFQYNTDLKGRIDIGLGRYYGVDVGMYANIGLTQESYQHFEESSLNSDWSYSGMPYGGASW